jgi:transposase
VLTCASPCSTATRSRSLSRPALTDRLYARPVGAARPLPDCAYIHAERKKPGVTLELLHLEYLEKYPDGYRYTQFCERYREWLSRRGFTMRQEHIAGEKLYVDYAGKKPHIVDPNTGELIEVELFVAVLGASNYTYAEATRTQRGPDFIASHLRAFRELGGVPLAVVPDQLKSGVTLACRYEPGIQRTYEDLAAPLRDDRAAGPTAAPKGQGEGGSRCADCRALDPWLGCATRRFSRSRRSTSGSPSCLSS